MALSVQSAAERLAELAASGEVIGLCWVTMTQDKRLHVGHAGACDRDRMRAQSALLQASLHSCQLIKS